MDMRGVQLILVLLLGFYTWRGDAQLICYSTTNCAADTNISMGISAKQCCMIDDRNGSAFQSARGEMCSECLVYGWKGKFPIKVSKGQVLDLTVGYTKGLPNIPRAFDVIFDSSEVAVNPRLNVELRTSDVTVRVTVQDDGELVKEEETITLGLVQTQGDFTVGHILLDTATLIIPADQVATVSLDTSEIILNEDERTSVCVSVIDAGPSIISVDLIAIPDSAVDADYIIMPTTMELSASQNRSCAVVDIVRDGLLEYNETFSIALRTTADNVVVDGTRNVTRIIIVDSDQAVVSVEPGSQRVLESNGSPMTVCLSVANSAIPVEYDVTVDDGSTAERGSDFLLNVSSGVLDPRGGQSCLQMYSVIDDDKVEGSEYLDLVWSAIKPRVTFEPPSFRLIIEDDDFKPSPSPSPTPPPSPSPSPSPLLPPPPPPPPNSVKDVVSGGALLTVRINAHSRINTRSPRVGAGGISLCYEVDGKKDQYLNLISDECLSVNAHYSEFDPSERQFNSIDEITVVVTNSLGENLNIFVDGRCNMNANSQPSLNSSGVIATIHESQVLISTDNSFCGGQNVLLGIECNRNRRRNDVMRFNVYRNLVSNDTAHGLMGQFWSLPISIERNGSDPTYYLIEVPQSGNQRRRFIGDQHSVTWQGETRKCFYVGDSQGAKGAWQHEGPNDPVIEGTYSDYITNGRFDTNFEFSQFGK